MRVKGGFVTRRRHKKLLKMAKGYRGARSKVYRVAKNAVIKALTNSYAHRKKKKRDFRRLWIMRINAAVREHGLSYSKFIHGLKECNIGLDRKVLADMAIKDKDGFAKLVEIAKTKV
jgi:large subunit ribosomal protein L20